MKRIAFLVVLFIHAAASFAQSYKADPAHSKLGFAVTRLGINDIHGYFSGFNAAITFSKPDMSDAFIELIADVSTINTGVEARDKDLRSANFFDAAAYPELTFRSTSVKKEKGNDFKVTGNLTMHGITRSVILDMTYRGTAKNPANNADIIGMRMRGTVKRSDFGIGTKYPSFLISDKVQITADCEFGIQ